MTDRRRIYDLLAPVRIRFEKEWENEQFPRINGKVSSGGCCDMWTMRAAEILRGAGFEQVREIRGYYRSKGRELYHCWAEVDGETVVDCTADQFDDRLDRVVIGTYAELPNYVKP